MFQGKTTLKALKTKKRDRKQYSAQRYQAKKQAYHEWYLKRKLQKQQQARKQLNKYYQAGAIKVLMSLKEYTELNSTKRKIWLNFRWVLQDLNQIGINNIIEVMKIREGADNLISDYWTTAKNEIRRGESWNSLDPEQKDRLIRYWSQEKVRKDQQLLSELEKQELAGKTYKQEIELAKFHEERGKIKCPCYDCENRKELQTKIKQQLFKEDKSDKKQCSECKKWVKELDGENEVCKNCFENYV